VALSINEVARTEQVNELCIGALVWNDTGTEESLWDHVKEDFHPVAVNFGATSCCMELDVDLRGEWNDREVVVGREQEQLHLSHGPIVSAVRHKLRCQRVVSAGNDVVH
jgi:hypothetical protein